ncbi:alpha/beta hydrolase [Cohnella luojiensis]|uniref:Alpha/beta hydrolase n=1 Tax=Cohnella luojiensis TaxID=652876 RepID=A0A4Y8LN20_9BACL|nr:alpha/beta hydrolase [Cohnella luojiensis]
MWKWARRLILYGLALMIVVLIIGYVYQRASVRADLLKYKPVGTLHDVLGRKMHIYTGGQGDSTVVFNAGWGTVNPYVDFYPLYDKIDKQARYAVVDRFGYGYSELTDRTRDIDNIVEETHELLRVSGVRPPYLMVGHSLSALESIRFAQRYPDEVKGIVLIDGGSPEYYSKHAPLTVISLVQRFLIDTGVARTLYHFDGFAESLASESNGQKLLPENLKELERLSMLLKANNGNITDEMRQSQKNAKKVLQGQKPLKVPMTIITAGSFGKAAVVWLESQKALPSWSVSGKQVIVEDAEHYRIKPRKPLPSVMG